MNKIKKLYLLDDSALIIRKMLFGKTCRVFSYQEGAGRMKANSILDVKFYTSNSFPLLCSCSAALFCKSNPLEANRLAFASIDLPVHELTVPLKKSAALSKWRLLV